MSRLLLDIAGKLDILVMLQGGADGHAAAGKTMNDFSHMAKKNGR